MKQEGYVNADGAPVVHKEIDKKTLFIRIGIVALVLFIIIFIFIIISNSNKNKKCNTIQSNVADVAKRLAKKEKKLPTVEGQSVRYNIADVLEEGLAPEAITVDKKQCGGTVTLTKYGKDYHASVDLTGCGYCATEERFGKWRESDKMPSGNAYVELVPSYNYYTSETNYGAWTDFLTPDQLSDKVDKEHKKKLPENIERIPDMPVDAHLVEIEEEKKNYYRYQDKRWKYYANANANCSAYVSEQPSGFATRDDSSRIESQPSKWSLSYPDEKDYRRIKRERGYRWYYKDGKEKIYWKNGEYSVEQPDPKYTEQDNESSMYSYTDYKWRWCNGEPRRYSSYTSTPGSRYQYRDDETLVMTTWSRYDEDSRVDDTNRWYRIEEIQVRSRFRYKYEIHSLPLLKKAVSAKELERQVGVPLEQFVQQPNIRLQVTYKYKYRK